MTTEPSPTCYMPDALYNPAAEGSRWTLVVERWPLGVPTARRFLESELVPVGTAAATYDDVDALRIYAGLSESVATMATGFVSAARDEIERPHEELRKERLDDWENSTPIEVDERYMQRFRERCHEATQTTIATLDDALVSNKDLARPLERVQDQAYIGGWAWKPAA